MTHYTVYHNRQWLRQRDSRNTNASIIQRILFHRPQSLPRQSTGVVEKSRLIPFRLRFKFSQVAATKFVWFEIRRMLSFRWEKPNWNPRVGHWQIIPPPSHPTSHQSQFASLEALRHSGLISKWRTQLCFMIDMKWMSDWLQKGCISDDGGFVNPGNCGRRRITAKTSIIKAANGSQWWIPGEKERSLALCQETSKMEDG